MTVEFFTKNKKIAELVATKISHDLSGVTGALSSSIELLEISMDESDPNVKEHLELAKLGAKTIFQRLKFFRAAFGLDGAVSSPQEAFFMTRDYLSTVGSHAAYEITWETEGISPLFLRIGMLACMIAGEGLIKGGKMTVFSVADPQEITVMGLGENFSTSVETSQILTDKELLIDISTPRLVPALFLKTLAMESGLVLDLALTQKTMILKISENK